MVNSQRALDLAYGALSDPTRRAMLNRLARGEATVGELAQPFAMSLPAVSKHVCVLERAGLLSRRRRGRHQVCRLEPDGLGSAAAWLERQHSFWTIQLRDPALTDPAPADLVRTETRGNGTVIATVIVGAPRPVVFTAFTDPAVLAQWFWPQRFGTRVEVDLRPGGGFGIRADGLSEGPDMEVTGTYRDIEAPARLTMTWRWTGEPDVSLVAIELHDVAEDRTEVVVTHSANPSKTDRDDHLQGWRDCLGRLLEAYGRPAS